MNRENVLEALDTFLASEELQTAALSGSWGIGKTHLWREFANQLELPESLNGISYASLFGVDTLSELRARITSGLTLTQSRKSIVERYKTASKNSLVSRELPAKGVVLLTRTVQSGMASLIREASYWFVRDCVVCLDDVERLGKGLNGRAVMGVVDELRDRGCKVVMVLNRDELPTEDSSFREYWEKIIDVDLNLSPNVQQNANIVFGMDFRPAEYAEWVRAVFEQVGCSNIRIHKRCGWLVKKLESSIRNLRQTVQKEVVEHAALLSWAMLDPKIDVSADIVSSQKYGSLWVAVVSHGNARDELSEEEEKWAQVIERTGYSPVSFDRYLVSLINTGWCDEAAFDDALQLTNHEEAAEQGRQRLYEAFRAFKGDFALDRDGYANLLHRVLTEERDTLSVFEYDGGVRSLAQLGQNVDVLVQSYIENRGDHLQAVAEAQGRDREPDDPLLAAEIRRREEAFQNNRFTIDQVALHLATSDSWGRNQIEFLASQSPDAYEAWLRSGIDGLDRKIRAILRFRGDNERCYALAVGHLETALRAIASDNEFNAERIARVYGVTIENAADN